jgi:hypothetical protein
VVLAGILRIAAVAFGGVLAYLCQKAAKNEDRGNILRPPYCKDAVGP